MVGQRRSVQQLVKGTQESLRKYARDFKYVQKAAEHLVLWAHDKLQSHTTLKPRSRVACQKKSVRKKKAIAGELALDESPSDHFCEYEVKVQKFILDRVAKDIRSWFAKHHVSGPSEGLYADDNWEEWWAWTVMLWQTRVHCWTASWQLRFSPVLHFSPALESQYLYAYACCGIKQWHTPNANICYFWILWIWNQEMSTTPIVCKQTHIVCFLF